MDTIKILMRGVQSNRNAYRIPVIKTAYRVHMSNKRTFTDRPQLSSTYGSNRRCDIVPISFCFGGLLSFFGEKTEEPEEDPVVKTIKLGILELQRGEFNKAEKLLHLALRLGQERADPQAETYCYDVLANIAFQKGDYQKAEKLFIETMKRMVNAGTPQDDNALIEMSLKLAKIYWRYGLDVKSEQGFQFCVTTQQKKVTEQGLENLKRPLTTEESDTLSLLGMSSDWYAKFLLEKRRFAEAKDLMVKAHTISAIVLGSEDAQTLTMYSDLGLVYSILHDHDRALSIFEKVTNVKSADDYDEMPAFLCNLGMTYVFLNDFDKAEEALERAKKLALKKKDEQSIKEVYECLAVLNAKKERNVKLDLENKKA